jgi:hypothetical protein
MTAFPVHYLAEKPVRYSRPQLVVRLIALIVLGAVGLSLGLVYFLAYLSLPAFAALRLGSHGDPERYLREDGPRIVRALRWFAAIYAWFGLVVEKLPDRSPVDTVHVDVEPMGRPNPASALVRLILGIPSAIVLAVLAWLAAFVWLWSAIVVLFRQRVGRGSHAYLTGVQRWSIRLLAYQASLIDVYPPFSFADTPPPAPHALPSA